MQIIQLNLSNTCGAARGASSHACLLARLGAHPVRATQADSRDTIAAENMHGTICALPRRGNMIQPRLILFLDPSFGACPFREVAV